MRALGYRTVDALVDWLSDPSLPPVAHAAPEELARRLGGGAPEQAEGFERSLARLFEDVLPYREPRCASALLRVRAVRRHLARRARRLRRERGERVRGLVAGRRRRDAAGARGARLVQGVDRLSGGRRRHAPERRLGGKSHRARLRARDARRLDARRPRPLCERSDALLDRACRADPRLPPCTGAGAPGWRRPARSNRRRSTLRSASTMRRGGARSSSWPTPARRAPER